MSSLSTLPKGDSAWLLRKAIERIMEQVSVLETNIGSSTTGNSANTQIIFNDNGTLRGDSGLTFNKTTDTLSTARITTSGDAIVCSSTGDFYVGTTVSPQFKVERATGNATITGALTVDTTTLVANAAGYADRVGIGTATPGAALEVSGSATNVFIRSTDTNDSALRYYVNGTEVAVCRGKNGNSYAIETAGAESFRINSTGNIVLKGGTAAANGVGVTFPATQVASSDANCLDDYEEGTWTGTLTGGTTNPATLITATGKYTKIGRQVSVQIAFESVSSVGYSGSLSITGLPFANAALRVIGAAGAFTGATFSGTLISQIESSASSILFYGVISNSAWTAATHNPSAGTFFWANLTYSV